jgi:hypothetical protein
MIAFYDLAIEDFPKLDLTSFSDTDLRELSYFVWAMYNENEGLMTWRNKRLLPLIRVESLLDEED